MPRRTISSVFLACLATLAASGCKTASSTPLEPPVRVVERVVMRPVPCPALAQLAKTAPDYPDTDAAIVAAVNLAERALLYATGRKLRIQREKEYAAAAAACDFQ